MKYPPHVQYASLSIKVEGERAENNPSPVQRAHENLALRSAACSPTTGRTTNRMRSFTQRESCSFKQPREKRPPYAGVDSPDDLGRGIRFALACLCLSVQNLPVDVARFDLRKVGPVESGRGRGDRGGVSAGHR